MSAEHDIPKAMTLAAQLSAADAAAPIRMRITADDEAALRFLFNDFGGVSGLRSSHGAQIDAMQAPQGTGYRGVSSPAERWVLDFPRALRDRVARVRRVLEVLGATEAGGEAVAILWAFYGPRPVRGACDWAPPEESRGFGAYLGIAPLTRTAQRLAAEASVVLRPAQGAKAFEVSAQTALALTLKEPSPARATILRKLRIESEQMLVRASSAFVAAARGVA